MMVRAKKVSGFKIDTDDIDDGIFESEQDARDSITVEEVTQYECGECNELFDDREEAKECCKE